MAKVPKRCPVGHINCSGNKPGCRPGHLAADKAPTPSGEREKPAVTETVPVDPGNMDNAYRRFLSASTGVSAKDAERLEDTRLACLRNLTTEELDGLVQRAIMRSDGHPSDLSILKQVAEKPNLSNESRELLKGFDDPEMCQRAEALAETSSGNLVRRMFRDGFIGVTSGFTAVTTFMASGFGLVPAIGAFVALASGGAVATHGNNIRTNAQFKQSYPLLTAMHQKAAAW